MSDANLARDKNGITYKQLYPIGKKIVFQRNIAQNWYICANCAICQGLSLYKCRDLECRLKKYKESVVN